GVRHAHADGGPKTVDAGGVDDVSLVGLEQQRHESAHAEIDAAPADNEGALPTLAAAGNDAAATADAGIVEQEMDLVGLLLVDQLVAEADVMRFDRDIGDMGGDAQALRQLLSFAQPPG